MKLYEGIAYGTITARVMANVPPGTDPWDALEEKAASLSWDDWTLEEIKVEDFSEVERKFVSPCCKADWGTKELHIKRCAECGELFRASEFVEA